MRTIRKINKVRLVNKKNRKRKRKIENRKQKEREKQKRKRREREESNLKFGEEFLKPTKEQ